MVLSIFPDNFAWLWDLIAMVIATVTLLLVVKINGKIQKSGKLPTYITRKIIHIVVAPIFLLTWFLYTCTAASRYIAMLVPLAFVGQFIAIGTGLMKDEDSVRSMSRTGDPKELLQGTLYYSIIILLVTIVWFYVPASALNYTALKGNPAAFVIIGCLAGGDGFADIIGRKYGKKKFGIAGAEKSFAGALGMFFGSFVFSMGLIALFSLEVDNFNVIQLMLPVTIISLVATIVELLSPPHIDNITIPIAVIIVIVLLFYLTPLWPFDLISIIS
jgi:dolichol kinase